MTDAKKAKQLGRKPSVKQCLEAWLRCVESDPSRVAPKRLRSNATTAPEGKAVDPWDEYCRQIVQDAAMRVNSPTQANMLLEITAHRMKNGRIDGWKCFNVVAISPADTMKTAKAIQVPGSMPKITPDQEAGMDLFMLATNSFLVFREVVRESIKDAKPYTKPPEDECDADQEERERRENKPIHSQTW